MAHRAEVLPAEVRLESAADAVMLVHTLPLLEGDVCARFFATVTPKRITANSQLVSHERLNGLGTAGGGTTAGGGYQYGGSQSSGARGGRVGANAGAATDGKGGQSRSGTTSSALASAQTGLKREPVVLMPSVFTASAHPEKAHIVQRKPGFFPTWKIGPMEAPQGFHGVAYPPTLLHWFYNLKQGSAQKLQAEKQDRPWLYQMKTTNEEGNAIADEEIADQGVVQYVSTLLPFLCSWDPTVGVVKPLLKFHYGAYDPHCPGGLLIRCGRTVENRGIQCSWVSTRLQAMRFRIKVPSPASAGEAQPAPVFFFCLFSVCDAAMFLARVILRNACALYDNRGDVEEAHLKLAKRSVHADPSRMLWKDVRDGVIAALLPDDDDGSGSEEAAIVDGLGVHVVDEMVASTTGAGGLHKKSKNSKPDQEALDGKLIAMLDVDVFRPLGLQLFTAGLCEDFTALREISAGDVDDGNAAHKLLSDELLPANVRRRKTAGGDYKKDADGGASAADKMQARLSKLEVDAVASRLRKSNSMQSGDAGNLGPGEVKEEARRDEIEPALGGGKGNARVVSPERRVPAGGTDVAEGSDPAQTNPPALRSSSSRLSTSTSSRSLISAPQSQINLLEQAAKLSQVEYEDLVFAHWRREAELEAHLGLQGATESWKVGGRPAGSPLEFLRGQTEKQEVESAQAVRVLLRVTAEYESLRTKARLQEYKNVNDRVRFAPGPAFGQHEGGVDTGAFSLSNGVGAMQNVATAGGVPFGVGSSRTEPGHSLKPGKIAGPLLDLPAFLELPVARCPLVLAYQPPSNMPYYTEEILRVASLLTGDSRLFTFVFENDRGVFYRSISNAPVLAGQLDLATWKLKLQSISHGRVERDRREDLTCAAAPACTANDYRGKPENMFSNRYAVRKQSFFRIKLAYIVFGGCGNGKDLALQGSAELASLNIPKSSTSAGKDGAEAGGEGGLVKFSPQREVHLLQRAQRTISFDVELATADALLTSFRVDILVHLADPARFVYCCAADSLVQLVFAICEMFLTRKLQTMEYVAMHKAYFRDLVLPKDRRKVARLCAAGTKTNLEQALLEADEEEEGHDQEESETKQAGDQQRSGALKAPQILSGQENQGFDAVGRSKSLSTNKTKSSSMNLNKELQLHVDSCLRDLRQCHHGAAERKSTRRQTEMLNDMTKRLSDYDVPKDAVPTGAGCVGARVVLQNPLALSALETYNWYRDAIDAENEEHHRRMAVIQKKTASTKIRSPPRSPVQEMSPPAAAGGRGRSPPR
eukprot:g17615.t1